MYKKILSIIAAIAFIVSLSSCSEENERVPKEQTTEATEFSNIDIKTAYDKAVELLGVGEEMVSLYNSGKVDQCMTLSKKHHLRTRELRKAVETNFPQQYLPLAASLGHMINCVSCAGSTEQCSLAKDFLQEANKLHKLSSK